MTDTYNTPSSYDSMVTCRRRNPRNGMSSWRRSWPSWAGPWSWELHWIWSHDTWGIHQGTWGFDHETWDFQGFNRDLTMKHGICLWIHLSNIAVQARKHGKWTTNPRHLSKSWHRFFPFSEQLKYLQYETQNE